LDYGKVLDFNSRGGQVTHGDFGENLLVKGIDLRNLPVGTKLQLGTATLEVTQIGKECHSRCQIYDRVGDCIMPREGIFAKVLSGGDVKAGDEIVVLAS
jgi:MOSC domain-containing protein YiiM